jgi:hypothetical protein
MQMINLFLKKIGKISQVVQVWVFVAVVVFLYHYCKGQCFLEPSNNSYFITVAVMISLLILMFSLRQKIVNRFVKSRWTTIPRNRQQHRASSNQKTEQ